MRFFVMMQSKYAKLAIFTFSRWTYSMMHNGADLHCCTFCTLGIHADAVTSQARYSRVVHLHVSARYSRQSQMNRQTCSCAAPSAVCCVLRALSVQHVPTSREESKIRTEKAILPTTGHTTALEEVVLSFETF